MTKTPTPRTLMRTPAGQDALVLMAIQALRPAAADILQEPMRALLAIAYNDELSALYTAQGLSAALVELSVRKTLHTLHHGNPTDVVNVLDGTATSIATTKAAITACLAQFPAAILATTDAPCLVIDEHNAVLVARYDAQTNTLVPMAPGTQPLIVRNGQGGCITLAEQGPEGTMDTTTARQAIVRAWTLNKTPS